MTARLNRVSLAALFVTSLCLCCSDALAQLRIGTFDASRGGDFSYGASSATSALRTDIRTAIPGAVFSTASVLTPAFLSTVDVVMLSSATGDTSVTAPLSAAEQAALVGFINNGGGALLFTDNDIFAGAATSAVNQSFVSPFGLHATGTLNGLVNATVANTAASPVTSSPFGLVPSFGTAYPGWYDNLGAASGLATLDANGKTTLAWIPKSGLTAKSGGIVFFSDTSFTENSFIGDNAYDPVLVENALTYASPAPEPGAPVAAAAFLVAMTLCKRRRRG